MSYKMKWAKWLFVGFLSISIVSIVQAKEEEIEKLAKDVQNPVSDLLRIGLLNTNTFGAGRNNYDFNVFDLQGIWAKSLGNGVSSTASTSHWFTSRRVHRLPPPGIQGVVLGLETFNTRHFSHEMNLNDFSNSLGV